VSDRYLVIWSGALERAGRCPGLSTWTTTANARFAGDGHNPGANDDLPIRRNLKQQARADRRQQQPEGVSPAQESR
jgi:hypothetical protein